MSEDGFQVTSEIYQPDTVDFIKPILSNKNVVTKFYFTPRAIVDDDGDLLVKRRNNELPDSENQNIILIEHSPQSSLKLVGRQVWRGALLLADYLMHRGIDLLGGQVTMEVGAGVGLTSIVAAMFAREVVCTDVDIGGILDLIRANASRNASYISANFSVQPLDFFSDTWSAELQQKLDQVTIILAADVIYDNDLTEGFVTSLMKILAHPPAKTVFFALEKRFVFTTHDLDSVAPCYEYFLNCLDTARAANPSITFRAEQLAIDFPQFFQYERVKQLVLWQIST